MDRYEFVDIDELLDKDLGELRVIFAYEDPDHTLRSILLKKGWLIDSEDNEPDDEDEDDYEDDDYSDDEDDEDEVEDYWGDYNEEEDTAPSDKLTEEEKATAKQIANDINDNKYSIDIVDDICDIYSQDFIDYLETLIDKEV